MKAKQSLFNVICKFFPEIVRDSTWFLPTRIDWNWVADHMAKFKDLKRDSVCIKVFSTSGRAARQWRSDDRYESAFKTILSRSKFFKFSQVDPLEEILSKLWLFFRKNDYVLEAWFLIQKHLLFQQKYEYIFFGNFCYIKILAFKHKTKIRKNRM
jgi:hypothetical protein